MNLYFSDEGLRTLEKMEEMTRGMLPLYSEVQTRCLNL